MLRILLILTICALGSALRLQLYTDIHYKGLIYDKIHPDDEEGCRNLTDYAQGMTGSVRLDRCIMAFESVDCQGFSRRLEPATEDLEVLMKPISSFLPCSGSLGGDIIRVDFFDAEGKLLTEYTDVCGCQDLPTKVSTNATRLVNYGNCVKIFQTDTCGGASKELPAGVSPDSEDLSSFGYFVRSISACGSCGKLASQIYKFELFFEEDEDELAGRARQVELAAKTTFFNNGSATVTQEYHASRTVRQSYTVTKSKSISSMSSYGVSAGVSVGLGMKSGDYSASIGASVGGSLTKAYSESSSSGESWTEEEEKTFAVTQTIQIPACVEYEVSSTVSIAENVPIRYELYTKVTGERGGRPMTCFEIQFNVPEMEFLEELDEYTCIYKTEQTMVASVGVDTFISGEGLNIPGCENGDGSMTLPIGH